MAKNLEAIMIGNQRGGALIFVIIVGMVMTTAFFLFMNSTVLLESRAVEASLAKERAYWAQMGNYNYALSRISYSKLCNSCKPNNKNPALAAVLQAYFNELSNQNTWTYADESSNYSITTTNVAAEDDRSSQTFSGWLMAQSTATPSALVTSSAGSLPQMELRLCVGLASNTGPSSKCGASSSNNGGNATQYFSINRLTNTGN